ncbi:hypothetical protein PIB30_075069 [Stylosanthes scabra]|uniref:Uncharacterized protein n=1 Tax=Stylosanthes scabra TaxID=79078 RepID=A0ABU6RR17_9FABA|nr:hypothetical protein [Stylosanthes scabra]
MRGSFPTLQKYPCISSCSSKAGTHTTGSRAEVHQVGKTGLRPANLNKALTPVLLELHGYCKNRPTG